MGRSVSQLSGAQEVCFFEWPHSKRHTCECGNDWFDGEQDDNVCTECGEVVEDYETEYEDAREVLEWLRDALTGMYPSLDKCDRWEHREDHIILESSLVEISIAEYCGLTSLSIRPYHGLEDSWHSEDRKKHNLAVRWINQVWPKIESRFAQARKIGTFGNGEAIYERV